ncbi:MAG: hypothetical protein WCE61_17680 [Candidatus Acidiferrum sp.]
MKITVVLAKLSVDEISSFQLLLPIAVGLNLINEDGSMLTSVPGQVALTVSLEIQAADATATTHRTLPDPGVYRALLPHDIARKPHVHR